jgi:hypothetical protein
MKTENRITKGSTVVKYGSNGCVDKWSDKWLVYHSGVVIAVADTKEQAENIRDKFIEL